MPHVDLGVHPRHCQSGPGTRAHAQVGCPPPLKSLVVDCRRGTSLYILPRPGDAAPSLFEPTPVIVTLLPSASPWVVGRPQPPREAAHQYERGGALWIGAGEQDRH